MPNRENELKTKNNVLWESASRLNQWYVDDSFEQEQRRSSLNISAMSKRGSGMIPTTTIDLSNNKKNSTTLNSLTAKKLNQSHS